MGVGGKREGASDEVGMTTDWGLKAKDEGG
jgi:hypothetical protein